MHSALNAVREFVRFADAKERSGWMKKSRLILYSSSRIKNAINGIFSQESYGSQTAPIVFFGDGSHSRGDPEYRPATTGWQKFGNAVRKVPKFLASEESTLGFRATLATMSIGIIAYFERTQHFFQEERIVWGMIMIAISMALSTSLTIPKFVLTIELWQLISA